MTTGRAVAAGLGQRRRLQPAPRRRAVAAAARVDAVAVATFAGGLGALSWALAIPWFFGNLLFLGVPLAYLLVRSPAARAIRWRFVARYVVFIVVFVDYLCLRYRAWSSHSLFPKLPGGVTVEQIVCFTLFIGLTLAVNEHFFATGDPGPRRRFGRPILIGMFLAGIVIALVPPLRPLVADHTYAVIGVALYPTVIALGLATKPRVARELALIALVATPAVLAFELVAINRHYWAFPGQYVGNVTVAGQRFPLEELVFFVVLSAPAVVAVYATYKNWKGMRRTP